VFSRLKTTRIDITVTNSEPPRGKMIFAASAAGRSGADGRERLVSGAPPATNDPG
jgi:hypothetical protein